MDDEIFVNSHTNSGNIPKMLALLSLIEILNELMKEPNNMN